MSNEIIRVTLKGNRIGLIVKNINDKTDQESTIELKDDTRLPHPHLLDKVEEFKFHLLRSISRQFAGTKEKKEVIRDAVEEFERIEVSQVEKSAGLIKLTGSQKSWGGTKNKIVASFPIGEASSYNFSNQIERDWENLKDEAVLFYEGKKFHTEQDPSGQTEIFDQETKEETGFTDKAQYETQVLG